MTTPQGPDTQQDAAREPKPPPPPPRVITADMLEEEDRRVEFERGMSYAPTATLILIGLYAAVFAWELATGALASREAIVAAGALVRDERPMLYRYVGSCKLASGERERRGFIALLPVDAPVSVVAPPIRLISFSNSFSLYSFPIGISKFEK